MLTNANNCLSFKIDEAKRKCVMVKKRSMCQIAFRLINTEVPNSSVNLCYHRRRNVVLSRVLGRLELS